MGGVVAVCDGQGSQAVLALFLSVWCAVSIFMVVRYLRDPSGMVRRSAERRARSWRSLSGNVDNEVRWLRIFLPIASAVLGLVALALIPVAVWNWVEWARCAQ